MKQKDYNPIKYPKGTSAKDRRFVRRLITDVRKKIDGFDVVVIACSGGIDSTVLAHAISQGWGINPFVDYLNLETNSNKFSTIAAYVNHKLRSEEELNKEIDFIKSNVGSWMTEESLVVDGDFDTSHGNIQDSARTIRYQLLNLACRKLSGITLPLVKAKVSKRIALLTAHNANDEVETRLFKYLTGRSDTGILPKYELIIERLRFGAVIRPLLHFTRKDIERYAEVFNLTWCEDSSNCTDKYTRNKIRHHLIPWIEENINPSVVETLSSYAIYTDS